MFENVTFDTKRGSKAPSSAQTMAPDTYLQGVIVNLRPMTQKDYNGLPKAALQANYIVTMTAALNPGKTDIGKGDRLLNINRLDKGCPYDDSVPMSGQSNSASIIWEVKYAPETRLGPLSHRVIYVLRSAGSGPGSRGY